MAVITPVRRSLTSPSLHCRSVRKRFATAYDGEFAAEWQRNWMSSGVTIRLAFLQATNASAKSVITIALWRLLFTSYTRSAMRNLEIKSRIPKKRQLQDSTAGPIASSKNLQAMKRANRLGHVPMLIGVVPPARLRRNCAPRTLNSACVSPRLSTSHLNPQFWPAFAASLYDRGHMRTQL
jgi:hypothetical protein